LLYFFLDNRAVVIYGGKYHIFLLEYNKVKWRSGSYW